MIKKISNLWKMLGRSIYTGERLKQNLKAITAVGILCALLGMDLMVFNYVNGDRVMFIGSVATLLAGAGCALCAGVLKNREAAIVFPTAYFIVGFTLFSLYGLGEGTSILWTMLLPLGMCYFISVRNGILLSIYYVLLYVLMFYTPYRERAAQFYSEAFMSRFPLVFISLSVLTIIAMVQYHRGSLLEIDFADEMNREVERQTRFANERAESLETLNREMVQTLAVTIDAKDDYTNGHSFRVSWYSMALAEHLGWPEEEVQVLGREALLHDIGKIGVPDVVLNKPGRLSNDEFSVIKNHTVVGNEILIHSKSLLDAADVARHHHERYDGRGYPDGLKGDEISLHARVVSLADSYDAMRSDRIYRKGLSVEIIREEMIKNRGTQFDPQLLDAFIELMDTGVLEEIAQREPIKIYEKTAA